MFFSMEVKDENGITHILSYPDFSQHTGSSKTNKRYWCRLALTDFKDLPEGHHFTETSWRNYLDRGILFQDAPVYIRYPWSSLVKMERRARRAGWQLIMRYTSHSGVCPPHIDAKWLQRTMWIWGLPGRQNMIVINYTEAKYMEDREINAYCEAKWCVGNIWHADDTCQKLCLPEGFTENGGMRCESYREAGLLCIRREEHSKLNPLRKAYDNAFWRKLAEQECPCAPFSELQVSGMDCSYVLPGRQTEAQRRLGIELQVAFMLLLHTSSFREWCLQPYGSAEIACLEPMCWSPIWYHYAERSEFSMMYNCVMHGLCEDGSWAPIAGALRSSIFDYKRLRISPTTRKALDMVWDRIRPSTYTIQPGYLE
jgi:hypothetical protein